MKEELILFLWSVAYGAEILFIYDGLRSLRNVVKHGKILITIEDLLFWIAVSIFLFTRIYKGNGGVLRSYFFVGVSLGMGSYYATISPYVVKFVSFLLKRLKMFILWVKITLGKLLHIVAFTGIIKKWGKLLDRKKEGESKAFRQDRTKSPWWRFR